MTDFDSRLQHFEWVLREYMQGNTTRDQVDEARAALAAHAAPGVAPLTPQPPTADVVGYVARWGGNCRDCADENGVCPNSGLPCGGYRKAIEHVIKALQYGVAHGYIVSPLAAAPTAAQPVAPPADVERDAARYRKWREHYTGSDEDTEMLIAIADAWTPQDLDAIIDAAMLSAAQADSQEAQPVAPPAGLTPATMKRGGRYNWKGQPDRLIYLRRFDGWHQFKKIGDPRKVWCEVRDEDLHMLEETLPAAQADTQGTRSE